MAAPLAEITRGDQVESVHQGSVAVVDGNGDLVAWTGDPDTHLFFRSSAKIFQAIPLVTTGAADAYGFSTEELALACASHNGTTQHQDIVRSMLRKSGLTEDDLRCGFTPPLDETELARITLGQVAPSQVICECSGEHAGMVAACRHAGWRVDEYIQPEHPLQRLIRAVIVAACGVAPSELTLATDGCSIPTFGAPLRSFARAYTVLADPDEAQWTGWPEWRTALHRLREAMLLHPELISGAGEIDTTIMQQTGGRVLAKLGAEGLLCLAVPGHQVGIAITDTGGSTRSLGPAAMAVLLDLDLIDQAEFDRLAEQLCPPIETFAGSPVGTTRPALKLERSPSA